METVDRIVALVTRCSALVAPILSLLEKMEALEAQARATATLDTSDVECDPQADEVVVDGVHYKRLAEASHGVYFWRRGSIEFERHLFREVGVRNGPTIVPLELRAGVVQGQSSISLTW